MLSWYSILLYDTDMLLMFWVFIYCALLLWPFTTWLQMNPSPTKKKTPAKKSDKRMKMDHNLFRSFHHFGRYRDSFIRGTIISVGHASDLHWAYWLVCPNAYSKCEWALWSLFYSDYLFGQAMVYYLIPFFAWSLCACFICITSFSSYNDHIVLLCFRRFLFISFKSYTDSRVRCEWVLFNYSQLTC